MTHRALLGTMLAVLALGVTSQARPARDQQIQVKPTPQTPARPAERRPAATQTRAQMRAVFLEACGRCHPPERVTATRRTKAQWEESINQMVTSRGAVLTGNQYDTVLRYLVAEFSPGSPAQAASPAAAAGAGASAGARAGAPAGAQSAGARAGAGAGAAPTQAAAAPRPRGGAGPDDKHLVDAAAAMRGRKTYAAACIQCHGTNARGTDRGSNIVRSLVLLHDRYGNEVGPFLRKGHQTQAGAASASFTDAQMADLSHFLHERLNDTLRGSPIFTVQDVLTGDRQAGAAYFNGPGGCMKCHSPTGDLARYGTRYDPPAIQQRFLFPRPPGRGPRGAAAGAPAAKPTTVTVTIANGETVSGVLVQMDDFNVSLRDATGQYRSFARGPAVTVVKNDPYAAHVAMLDTYTDKNIHDVVAYLESLK